MSTLRLRQVTLVAERLEPVVEALVDELGLAVGHRDPDVAAFGLVNALLPVGHQFLEVVAPTRPDTAAGRHLARLGGDGGYMVVCQTDDQAPFRARAEELGIRTAFAFGNDGYDGWQLHPGDTGGSFLEIDHQPPGPFDPWQPAGSDWADAARTDVVERIVAVELSVPDVVTVRDRWRTLLGREHFDDAELRWTTGDGGLVAVDLHATDRSRAGEVVPIGGIRFRLV